jgi:hypothetical protein
MACITIGYAIGWIYWTALVFSQGTLVHKENLPFMHIELTDDTKKLLLFNLFNICWAGAFFLTVSHFVITCSTCIWYTHSNKTDLKFPISKSAYWMLRYHLGTLAFGSLILAIVWLMIIIAEYMIVPFS